jgi:hypothetical protein
VNFSLKATLEAEGDGDGTGDEEVLERISEGKKKSSVTIGSEVIPEEDFFEDSCLKNRLESCSSRENCS